MIPLNNPERRSSFFVFLLFFVVTISIVMLTAFYGIQVPVKENEQMKKQIADFQKERVFAQTFADRLSKTRAMLDKINLPGVANTTEGYIKANITKLTEQVGDDTTATRKIYVDIIANLSALDQAQKTVRDNNNSAQDKQDLERKLSEVQSQLTTCATSNANLIVALKSASGGH
ncbi:MAG TPA: type VI secretion system TssO [Mucilaginibacter sp.]|nr:type VI secretion system TssO [Mucilaginibacter sp.]